MPREIVELPTPDEGSGIIYLAVLAYPEDNAKRVKFARAMGGLLRRIALDLRAFKRGQISPGYGKKATAESTMRDGFERIRTERLHALYCALALMFKRYDTDDPMWSKYYESVKNAWIRSRHPKSRKHASERFYKLLADHIDEYVEVGGETGIKQLSMRHWKRSMPVLHLMLALPLGLKPITHLQIGKYRLPVGWKEARPLASLATDLSWVDAAWFNSEIWRSKVLPQLLPDFDESKTIQLIPSHYFS